MKALVCPWESSPRGQRLFFALTRWKKVCDAIYTDTPAEATTDADLANATVGTPFRFGQWFPRAALDVPSYTTVYFQNARVSMMAPRPKHLPHRYLLPCDIYFYVRTKTCEVKFPLPEADYPSSKYLHVAKVIPGHEAGGPTAHMAWTIDSVIGLKKHQCTHTGLPHRSIQLVIVVPSTKTVNPGVQEAQLAFSPFSFAQLHHSRRLPRVIVPLFPRSSFNEITRYVDAVTSGEKLSKLKTLMGSWDRMSRRDIKRASFFRWMRVCEELEARQMYKPPEPQIGSPFVELLPDRGEMTNLARWPRLERAQHLINNGGVDNPDLARWKAAHSRESPRKESPRRAPHQSAAVSAANASLQLESRPTMSLDVEAAQRLQLGVSPRRSPSPQAPSSVRDSYGRAQTDDIIDQRVREMYGDMVHGRSDGSLSARMPRSNSSPRLGGRTSPVISGPPLDSARGTLSSSIPYTPRGSSPQQHLSSTTSQACTPRSASSPRGREPVSLSNAMHRQEAHLQRQEQALFQPQQQPRHESPRQVRLASPRPGSPRMSSPRMGSPRRIHERV